jgi:tetratricopeptide (TPR) repeat protein
MQARQEGSQAIAKKDYDRAIEQYSIVLKGRPDEIDAWLERSYAFGNKNDFDRAFADADQAVNLCNKQQILGSQLAGRAYFYRAKAWILGKGDMDNGIADLNQAIRLGWNTVESFRFRAYAHSRKGEEDAAISDYTTVLQLDSKHAAAKTELAELMYDRAFRQSKQVGNTKETIEDLTIVINLNPQHAKAFLLRSIAYFGLGDLKRSELDRQEAVRLDPSLDFEFGRRPAREPR